MIEKLGITSGPWECYLEELPGSSTFTYLFHTVIVNGENLVRLHKAEDARLIAAAPQMLEALIVTAKILEFSDHIKIIEKATGRTWQEVKEIING